MKTWYRTIITIAAVILLGVTGCTSNTSSGVAHIGEENEQTEVAAQPVFQEKNTSYAFRVEKQYFQRYNGKEFEDFYAVGVNVGTGIPNAFPGDMSVTQREYEQWFEEIAAMHANTIRVYTVLSPAFYDAFYEYNVTHEEKLYLFQGCWYDEDTLNDNSDAYLVLDSVKKDLKDLVDIFHGKAQIEEQAGHASGTYTKDISPYVIGWILGIESDQKLVETTNVAHSEVTGYAGDYLTCSDVQPYEAFWCEIGDYVLKYEDEKYGMQRPVSYSNWPTADAMEHPNEPLEQEDAVSLNAEDLKPTDKLASGRFVSYHVYPYYPNFMFEEEPYKSYVDEDGKINTYKRYLMDLINLHQCPVLIAEFGVPTSRGITHVNTKTGYNQGGLNETEQGEMLVSMFEDIKETGCAGGLVFTWQDEWFKRTWNTMDYNNSDRRAFWNDVQTCEQHFGLLAFDSAENEPTPVIDGKADEWTEDEMLLDKDDVRMYAKVDSTYLYLMLDIKNADYEKGINRIYFDISPEKGANIYKNTTLDCDADFVLEINGKNDTRLRIHEDSDLYHYIYRKEDPYVGELFKQSADGFGDIYQITDRELLLPQENRIVPVQRVETGLLRYGTSDLTSKNFDSLTDFCYKGDIFEVRIPWGLLGFRDPSHKEIDGNFLETGSLDGVQIDGIKIGYQAGEQVLGSVPFTWENWEQAYTKKRLRQSYTIVQEYLSDKENVTVSSK